MNRDLQEKFKAQAQRAFAQEISSQDQKREIRVNTLSQDDILN